MSLLRRLVWDSGFLASSPMRTTTYGVGQLISHALQVGHRRIVLGLGGSATTDMGCGMAAALGTQFLNAKGAALPPGG